VAQALNVVQPFAAAQDVVGQVEHVVRLVVGQVDLQQLQALVDGFGQPQLGGQPVDGSNAAEAHGVGVRSDLVVDRARGEHGPGLGLPVSGLGVATGNLTLALCPVPAALFVRDSLHRKGPLGWSRGSRQELN
jgi:hypothetical protein